MVQNYPPRFDTRRKDPETRQDYLEIEDMLANYVQGKKESKVLDALKWAILVFVISAICAYTYIFYLYIQHLQ